MRATINVAVGRAGDSPVMLLRIISEEMESPLELDFSVQEAQQLGTAILVSCGVAIERVKKP